MVDASQLASAPLDRLLADAIAQAVENYRRLAFADPPDDAKLFQVHQAACKAALAHIEALLKFAPSPAQGLDGPSHLDAVLADALAEVAAFDAAAAPD